MSYTKHYNGTTQQRTYEAFCDACDYLGDKNFVLVINYLQDAFAERKVKQAKLALSFVGLQGLPAAAMIAYAWRGKGCLREWSNYANRSK